VNLKALVNGTIVTPSRQIQDGVVLVEGNKIIAVGPEALIKVPQEAEVIDAEGGYIAPGYIDVHCHGAIGVSTSDEHLDVAAIRRVARFKACHGTTAFLLAVATAPPDCFLRALAVIHEAVGADGGAELLGAQAEGPFFNPEAKGAQAEEHIRKPSTDEFDQWLRVCPEVRLVSLAPEMDGALEFIPYARERGVTVAVGHSRASYEEVIAAAAVGLTHATHTFNGMLGLHHRSPGTAGAILTCDDIMAEAIVDNIHLHPATVDLIIRSKGSSHVVLVTDAVNAAGLPDGVYTWDGRRVTLTDGAIRLDSGALAGSTLTMDRAVQNVLQDSDITVSEAIRMATLNPARSIHVDDRKGSLAAGKDADIIILNQGLEVQVTISAGQVVYRQQEGEPQL